MPVRPEKSLINTLMEKNSLRLLKVFLFKPGAQMYQNEVIRMSGLSKNTAMKLLNLFTLYGMLKVSRKGNLKLFSLVEEHPAVKQLKVLIDVSELYEALNAFSGKGFEVYLFGSSARGEDSDDSDFDILIIGKISGEILSKLEASVRKHLNRTVNPVIKNPYEYSKLFQTDKAFYENLERDKVRII